jgi:hypothetical protein
VDTPEAVQEFVESIPGLLAETIEYVGADRVQAFLDRTFRDSLEAIKGYLS